MGLLDQIANPGPNSYLEGLKVYDSIETNRNTRRLSEIQAGLTLQKMQAGRQAQQQRAKGYDVIRQGLSGQPTPAAADTSLTGGRVIPVQRGEGIGPPRPAAAPPGEEPVGPPQPAPAPAAAEEPMIEGGIAPAPEIQQPAFRAVAQIPIDYIGRAKNVGDIADRLATNPQMQKEAKMFYEQRDKAEELARTQTKLQRQNAQEFTAIAGGLFEHIGRMEESGNIQGAAQEYNKQIRFLAQDTRLQNNPEAQRFIQTFSQYQPGLGKYMYLATTNGAKARDQFQKEPRLTTQKYGDTIESVAMGLFDRSYKSLSLPERQQVLEYKTRTAKEISAVQGRGILPPSTETKASIVIAKTQEAFDKAGNWSAGLASITKWIPGSPARDLSAVIDTIQANIGFAELNQMRQESKTGGALGQVTVRELELLQSVIASLDQAQSVGQLKKNILEIQDHYKKAKASYQIMKAVRYAKEEDIIDLPNGGQIEIIKLSPDGNHQYRRIK